jgi:hypothetical protein
MSESANRLAKSKAQTKQEKHDKSHRRSLTTAAEGSESLADRISEVEETSEIASIGP